MQIGSKSKKGYIFWILRNIKRISCILLENINLNKQRFNIERRSIYIFNKILNPEENYSEIFEGYHITEDIQSSKEDQN